MPSDYTPTTEDVRAAYRASHRWPDGTELRGENLRIEAEFSRWLAAHDAEIRESIAREIETQMPEMGCDINITDYRRGRWSGMTDSARIARGETDQ